MRYNREDIRDKLLDKCFPQQGRGNSQLYNSRLQYSRQQSRESSISNTPIFVSPDTPLRRGETSLDRSRVDVQPITFKRASSLVNMRQPRIENSGFNYIPPTASPQPQYFVPRVQSYQSIQPLQLKPIMRPDFLQSILPKGFEPASQIVVKQISRVSTPIPPAKLTPVSSTSIDKAVKSSSSLTNLTTNFDTWSRVTPAPAPSPVFKSVKQPQKISMRGVTIRRQINRNGLYPMEKVKGMKSSIMEIDRWEQEKKPPKQSLDGILSQICGGVSNCSGDKYTVDMRKSQLSHTSANFRSPSNNWRYLP